MRAAVQVKSRIDLEVIYDVAAMIVWMGKEWGLVLLYPDGVQAFMAPLCDIESIAFDGITIDVHGPREVK